MWHISTHFCHGGMSKFGSILFSPKFHTVNCLTPKTCNLLKSAYCQVWHWHPSSVTMDRVGIPTSPKRWVPLRQLSTLGRALSIRLYSIILFMIYATTWTHANVAGIESSHLSISISSSHSYLNTTLSTWMKFKHSLSYNEVHRSQSLNWCIPSVGCTSQDVSGHVLERNAE